MTSSAESIERYLASHESKGLLRFITCGSVDDGKSTLIGRLLYESLLVLDDQLSALEVDSRKFGTQGDELDFALLVDGLSAEREQGITIDVAYRFFTTDKRKFVVADTPGHEQYTRNMVTGASTADLAVILIDARKGVLTQTRRHSYLVSLLGITKVVLAINKLDIVGYSETMARTIEDEYRAFADLIGLHDITCIPMSALRGDNVTVPSANMPWYTGPTLLEHLETVDTVRPGADVSLRMPVQWVNRPNSDFRGYSGTLIGTVAVGERVVVLPAGTSSTVARLVTADGDLARAESGQAITVVLAEQIDASRGDVICSADDPPHVGDQFEAHIIWMSEDAMRPGRPYVLKHGARTVNVSLSQPKHKVNVNTLETIAAHTLELNEIGVCNLSLDRAIPFEPYRTNRDMGSFIIIDRQTNETVGAGLLQFGLRRGDNVHRQSVDVNKSARADLKGQRPGVVWFTGISGAGKSTIANLLERRLHALGRHTYLMDGDNVRLGLNRDLGFTEIDRIENIRRVAEVSQLMVDAGLIVLVSFISPYRIDRDNARAKFADDEFCEVHVDTTPADAEARDIKGLYAKARRGELPNFTGIDAPYEGPLNPEVHIATSMTPAEQAAEQIIDQLRRMKMVP